MNLFDFSTEHILRYVTILIRTSLVIYFIPVFGDAFVPMKLKAFLAMIIALVLYPVVAINVQVFPTTFGGFFLAMIPEFLFAAGIGLVGKMLFAGIQAGGQLAGMQIGFGFANVVSPTESHQISVMAQFQYLLSLLTFFLLNIHYFFFKALASSFDIIPPFQLKFSGSLLQLLNERALAMFALGIKISAPVIAAMLLVNVVLGLISKAVPQMNVFIESFPVRILFGIFVFVMSLSFIMMLLKKSFFELESVIITILRLFAPAIQ